MKHAALPMLQDGGRSTEDCTAGVPPLAQVIVEFAEIESREDLAMERNACAWVAASVRAQWPSFAGTRQSASGKHAVRRLQDPYGALSARD